MTSKAEEANLERDLPAPPEEGGGYDYEDLTAYHEEIIRLKALTPRKITHKEIADIVGCHKQTVSNVLNSKLGQEKMQMLQSHADSAAKEKMEKIEELGDYAIAVKEKLLLDPNTDPKLRDRIASDLLDRSGTKKAEKHQHEVSFTADKMREIKQRAKESASVSEAKVIEETKDSE